MIASFAVVVPVYNPEPGLLPLCEELVREFPTVIVVDDGSTVEIEAFDGLPSDVVRLSHEVNRGKGRAMKTAMEWIRDHRPNLEGVVFVDGDGQHLVRDAVAVAESCEKADQVTFGVRDFSLKRVPFRSWWGNRWTSIEVWLLFGYRDLDTQTGLRAIPKRLLGELLALKGERFEYEAGWFGLLHRLKEGIAKVPISTVYHDSNRASHFRPLRDTLLTQKALFGWT